MNWANRRIIGMLLCRKAHRRLSYGSLKLDRVHRIRAGYADLGASEGGYNEDQEFFGYRAPI